MDLTGACLIMPPIVAIINYKNNRMPHILAQPIRFAKKIKIVLIIG